MVELLVIIAVICILASLLLPAVAGSISRARQIACCGNINQIGRCVTLYSSDNQGCIPNILPGMEQSSIPIVRLPNGTFIALGRLLNSYTADVRIFGCPGSPGYEGDKIAENLLRTPMLWSAYLYRSCSSGFAERLADPANADKALAADFACVTASGEQFAPHDYMYSTILYSDCHTEIRRNSRIPFELYTVQAARHGELIPDCSSVWKNTDK